MSLRTYQVTLRADAHRTLNVRAESASDAAAIAATRAGLNGDGALTRAGWFIDQGAMTYEESVSVADAHGVLLGPWGQDGGYDDEAGDE